MSTLIPDSSDHDAADRERGGPTPAIDYAAAEGFTDRAIELAEDDRRNWIYVGLGLVGLVAVLAALIAVVALATGGDGESQPKGVKFEPFERVGDMVKGALGVLANPNARHAAGH